MPASCAIFATAGMSQHFQAGITDGLAMTSLVLGLMAALMPSRSRGLTKVVVMPKTRQRMGQDVDAAAVERRRSDDLIAGIEQSSDGEMQRGHAACGADRADTVLQCCETFFQHCRRGIGNAGVDVTRAFQIEECCGVVSILKDIGCRLMDRNGARAGHGSGCWPACRLSVSERWRFRRGHGCSPGLSGISFTQGHGLQDALAKAQPLRGSIGVMAPSPSVVSSSFQPPARGLRRVGERQSATRPADSRG